MTLPRLRRLNWIAAASRVFVLLWAGSPSHSSAAPMTAPVCPDSRFRIGELLVQDDFDHGLDQWHSEVEKAGTVSAAHSALDISVPAGCSVWLKRELSGPLLITYDATLVQTPDANERVSDLNCFWMAQDSRSPRDIFATVRSGKFTDYDQLRCYYVGQGGNGNKTTRFRRYIGERGNRPILPEHDLSAREFMLTPNHTQTVALIAAGSAIGYYRDGRAIFRYDDPEPYTHGWFAFRTTWSHLQIRHFRVYRLAP